MAEAGTLQQGKRRISESRAQEIANAVVKKVRTLHSETIPGTFRLHILGDKRTKHAVSGKVEQAIELEKMFAGNRMVGKTDEHMRELQICQQLRNYWHASLVAANWYLSLFGRVPKQAEYICVGYPDYPSELEYFEAIYEDSRSRGCSFLFVSIRVKGVTNIHLDETLEALSQYEGAEILHFEVEEEDYIS